MSCASERVLSRKERIGFRVFILVVVGCSVVDSDFAVDRRLLPRRVWSGHSWASSMNCLLVI